MSDKTTMIKDTRITFDGKNARDIRHIIDILTDIMNERNVTGFTFEISIWYSKVVEE